jgi:hypothetical protein
VIPLEEKARQRLKGINQNQHQTRTTITHSSSFASPRVRARSEGNLNLRETTTDYYSFTPNNNNNNSSQQQQAPDVSLTSTLLATGEDDALTVSRHGGLRNTVHENLKDMDFQFSPFLGEMDQRLKRMLNLAVTDQQSSKALQDKIKLNAALPNRTIKMGRQASDPLSGSGTSQSIGGVTSSQNSTSPFLFPDSTTSPFHRLRGSNGNGGSMYEKLRASCNKSVVKAKELMDLFTTGPSTRAGSTGFVTFNSLTAATSACQLTLSHRSFTLQVRCLYGNIYNKYIYKSIVCISIFIF